MLLIIGTVLNVTQRHVSPANSAPFSVTVVHVLVGKSRVEFIDLGKDFGPAPVEGEEVALRVSVQAYVSKQTGKAGFNFVAWENVSQSIQLNSDRSAA